MTKNRHFIYVSIFSKLLAAKVPSFDIDSAWTDIQTDQPVIFSELSCHLKQMKMTKNDISHFCQISQNFQWLKCSLDTDSVGQKDRSACKFQTLAGV